LDIDKDGNVFLGYPPSVMMPLVDWLTVCLDAPPRATPPDIIIPKEYRDMWDGVVKFFGLESLVQPPFAVFSGIKTNLKISELQDWDMAFCKPYYHSTTLADFELPGIARDSVVLMGAKKADTDELIVAAIGRLDIITAEKTSNSTQLHNGVHWYCTPGRSMGFAPNSTVQMQDVDVHDVDCPMRLSWSLLGCGGWRAGSLMKLTWSYDFEKVIMTPQHNLTIDA